MAHGFSRAQIRTRARVKASRIQARAHQAARDNQRRIEQRIRTLTCNGTKPLTKSQIEQVGRESAEYLRRRMK